jgi:methylated-DNA-protein-cysteine methyltransferase-like protein
MDPRSSPPSFFERVYQVVRMVPFGQVATYGQVAAIVSHRGAARTVGWALHGLAEGSDVPWHRVINARGEISLGPDSQQPVLLAREGIVADEKGRIDLQRHQWAGLDWPDVEALRYFWRASSGNDPSG